MKLNLTSEKTSSLHSKQTLYKKSLLHSVRKHLIRVPKKSISMPEKLDTVSLTKQKLENSVFALFKKKEKQRSKISKVDINAPAKEFLEAPNDEESFVSRWFVQKLILSSKFKIVCRSDVTVVI